MRPGDMLADRFVIDTVDGTAKRGGIGVVHRGWDTDTSRPVAIKLLARTAASDLARFEREATVLAELALPGVVRHVSHGTTPDGRPYLVMEWLEGTTVADHLERTGFTPDEAIALVAGICTPLAALHARGIVHRDLKPENIILVDGAPVLVDFGLARSTDATRPRVTATGCALGTPGYMAPEQVRAQDRVDARCDVFALGCVLYECLTGEAAFAGENHHAVRAKILFGAPAPLRTRWPAAPDALVGLVDATLAKAIEQRPADAGVLARALGALPAMTGPRRPWRAVAMRTEVAGAATMTFDRWTALVLVALANPGDSARRPDELSAMIVACRPTLERAAAGMRLELLEGGALLAIAPAGAPGDVARRGVAAARALVAALPGAIALAACGDEPFDELIDRAATELDRVTRAATFEGTGGQVFLDAPTGRAVADELPVVPHGAGYRLG